MPRATAPKPRKKAAAAAKPLPPREQPPAKAAVPEVADGSPVEEPVWLVRIVLVLFFVGFAAFLAREVYNFKQWLP